MIYFTNHQRTQLQRLPSRSAWPQGWPPLPNRPVFCGIVLLPAEVEDRSLFEQQADAATARGKRRRNTDPAYGPSQ